MRKLTLFTSSAVLALLIISLPVHAEDSTDSGRTVTRPSAVRSTIAQERATAQASREARRQETVDAKCTLVMTNVDTKIGLFDSNERLHQAQYKMMKERLARIVIQLKAKGLDTSKLETDIVTLDTKIQKFATDYTAYIAKLKDTKNYTCGHSDGEFRSSLQKARTSLLPVRQDVIDIQNFYRTAIRLDLTALRREFAKKQPTVSPSQTTTEASPSATPEITAQ